MLNLLIISLLFSPQLSFAAVLFEPCISNDDCTRAVGNSICSFMQAGCGTGNRVCLCASGYRADGTLRCLTEAHLDQPCGDGAVCVDPSSTCMASRCECLGGYRRNLHDKKRCQSALITSNYGQYCRDSVQCDGTQECVNNKCTCLPGYVFSPTLKTCVEINLGDSCKSDDDCLAVFNAVCAGDDPAQKVCACESGFLSTPVTLHNKQTRLCLTNSVELRDVGQPCSEDVAVEKFCKPTFSCLPCPYNQRHSVCTRNLPNFKYGPLFDPITTPKVVKPEIHRHTMTYGKKPTTTATTAADDEYYEYEDTATQTPPHTKPPAKPHVTTSRTTMTTSEDEYYYYDETTEAEVTVPVTTAKRVVTKVTTPINPVKMTTTEEYVDYETEETVAPTTQPATINNNHRLRTIATTTVMATPVEAKMKTEVYDYVLATEEIPATTPATINVTVTYAALGFQCAPPKVICNAPNSECFASRCQCIDSFRQLGTNHCHKVGLGIPLDFPCTEDDNNCETSGASCVSGRCQCPARLKGGLKNDCIDIHRNGTAGSFCEHSHTCYYSLSCVNNRCRCLHGFRQIQNYDCVPRVLDDPCPSGYDRDCKLIRNGVCKQGNCNCREGYTRKNASLCVEALWIQTSDDHLDPADYLRCNADIDCADSAVAPKLSACINNTCQCRTAYVYDTTTNKCQYTGTYSDEGFACNYDSDCHTAGLKCVQNKCSRSSSIMSSANSIVNSHSFGFVLLTTTTLVVMLRRL